MSFLPVPISSPTWDGITGLSYLLNEDGTFILNEDTEFILLEQSTDGTTITWGGEGLEPPTWTTT